MAIKDKDGKVYVLRGPNPLVKDRCEWDKSKISFYNLSNIKTEIVKDTKNPIKEFKKNIIDIGEKLSLSDTPSKSDINTVIEAKDFINEINESSIQQNKSNVLIFPKDEKLITPKPIQKDEKLITPKPTPINEIKPVAVTKIDEKIEKLIKERGVEYYCCPAVGRNNHLDDIYQNSYGKIEYGQTFIYDAIIIDQSDLELQFWCMIPIPAQSIVYRKEKGERWWKIKDVEQKTGGWIVNAIISDVNPDFS